MTSREWTVNSNCPFLLRRYVDLQAKAPPAFVSHADFGVRKDMFRCDDVRVCDLLCPEAAWNAPSLNDYTVGLLIKTKQKVEYVPPKSCSLSHRLRTM